MQIRVYAIAKPKEETMDRLAREYFDRCAPFATLSYHPIMPKNVEKAQRQGEAMARQSYTDTFVPHLGGYSVILDERGEEPDSLRFSRILEDKNDIRFFIGGAYGFEENFRQKGQQVIRLSRLTMGHKLAMVVLAEQIYRGLCIIHRHPYHK